jgi:VWFA-related protein
MKPTLFIFALSGGLAFAQPDVPIVIRSNTRLVLVNVVARDKNGPVADLKQEDFVVLDRGKRRRIASFAVETAASTMPGTAPSLPPNVFTNSLQRQSETPTSVTVILFDGLNTPITDQPYARRQVVKFLATLRPEDRVALYAMGRSSIEVLHDFSDDPRDLARMIQRYRGVADSTGEMAPMFQRPGSGTVQREMPSAAEEKVGQMLDHLNRMVANSDMATRVRVTTQALEAVANHLAPLPGRKNLVWISASFPFSIGLYDSHGLANPVRNEYELFRDDIARAARALNQANIAIYPVDARGLMVTGAYSAALSMTLGTDSISLNQVTSWMAAINNAQYTMEELAGRTGGKAFYNTNDIAGSVRRAIDDTQVSYVLGFYPDEGDLDGKYHELQVQAPGRKGLALHARQGYYADDRVPTPEAALQAELRQAVMGPLQASRIGLTVRVTRTAQPGPDSIHLDLQVSARELMLKPNGDRWQGSVGVSVVQLDAQGKVLDHITDPIKLNLKNESLPQYRDTGMPFGKDVQVKGGLAQLRIIAIDPDSGAMGSVVIPMSQVQ